MITLTCGIAKHTIYAHDPLLITDPQPVTKVAIEAVRDYMVEDIPKGKDSVGYAWKRGDGKTVQLICLIKDDATKDSSTKDVNESHAE